MLSDGPVTDFGILPAVESSLSGLVIFSGAIITGIGISLTAKSINHIRYNNSLKKSLRFELKRFEPISFKYSPGLGIGLIIPL